MLAKVRRCSLVLLLTGVSSVVCYSQSNVLKGRWKGSAILGNGHLTLVYSDDSRINALTHGSGIQHFYFKDYTADYIASTSFTTQTGKSSGSSGQATVGMKNFFTAQTQRPSAEGLFESILCFAHPDDTAVLALALDGSSAKHPYRFEAQLRDPIKTDKTIRLSSLRTEDNIALATWSNGTVLGIAPRNSQDKIAVTRASVVVNGNAGGDASAQILLSPGASRQEVLTRIKTLRQRSNLEDEARAHWEAWINSGKSPRFKTNDEAAARYLEAYKRNLYCVKSASLNGQIPADITGQFVTNNMPQLYPRDAMMCARVLLLTGHSEEAKQVIEFWADRQIPMKSLGEWYARYDAHGKAVDGGSGARYDEPEWDSNGYFIYLLNEYHRVKGAWPVDVNLIYPLADFLVKHIGPTGLLQEGGIVEWTGYLPATNMICAVALERASRIAAQMGKQDKAKEYSAASQTIGGALPQTFDQKRQTYADVRFTGKKGASGESLTSEAGEKMYLWDTTANVGAIWGYPNHHALEVSNAFYARNTIKLGGGMQYFDSPDPGLASYGHDVFFFTTAAAAQYECLRRNKSAAKSFIDWMLQNANSYGLMPERVLLNDTDCSPASPLSWCSAEFAAALLRWSEL